MDQQERFSTILIDDGRKFNWDMADEYSEGTGSPMSTRRLQVRYSAAQARLEQRFAAAVAATSVDIMREADLIGKCFNVLRKRRDASQYADIADYLLSQYPSEVAYFVAVEINEQFEQRLGYPPIGQITMALENLGSKGAARWIGCSLRNFPRVETAQLAFGVIRSTLMRSLVRADLAAEDSELAEFITAGQAAKPLPKAPLCGQESVCPTEGDPGYEGLSDGIAEMPRRMTDAEQRGDRLFLHLQAVSLVILILFPIFGGVLGRWIGIAVGLVAGWFTRVWIRRSMGIRGSNPHDGFFIRMQERSNGSRRGILEMLIERVRRRPFTRAQCTAMTDAWDETQRRLAVTTSVEKQRALIDELDTRIKRISYGPEETPPGRARSETGRPRVPGSAEEPSGDRLANGPGDGGSRGDG